MKKVRQINLGLIKVNSIDYVSQLSIGGVNQKQAFQNSMKISQLIRQQADRSVAFHSVMNIDDRDLFDSPTRMSDES
ncbi:MAG: hypothetical protein E7L01_23955 [Paenibacillus macerans]|uniref:Uncharacterized protein n=1 Tax=Paenibacillus macerans TaxID=44252 RepID=A0A6N8EN86_PAEMA|nr:hypothetical protein [Paenibacillus macerans]MDU7476367.1 hypothetical protein [Paenibacillus macerans]MEC0331714.1 hypothetical protein [Paenibacillus macerans]MUG21045.1 hypothetical protein [Paenibacillus macerans]UMV48635.1 hypothetical protein LMZ02_04375 [Paenibacillus macerans]